MTAILYLYGIAVLVVGGVIGAICHELTHWVVAWVLGRPASIRWRAFETVWESDGERGPRDYAISLAPLSVGLGVLAYVLTTPLTLSLPVWIAWGVYTLNGSLADFRGGVLTDTESPTASS